MRLMRLSKSAFELIVGAHGVGRVSIDIAFVVTTASAWRPDVRGGVERGELREHDVRAEQVRSGQFEAMEAVELHLLELKELLQEG